MDDFRGEGASENGLWLKFEIDRETDGLRKRKLKIKIDPSLQRENVCVVFVNRALSVCVAYLKYFQPCVQGRCKHLFTPYRPKRRGRQQSGFIGAVRACLKKNNGREALSSQLTDAHNLSHLFSSLTLVCLNAHNQKTRHCFIGGGQRGRNCRGTQDKMAVINHSESFTD